MKPLNLDNRPCSPISSNCVIWQGPDIPCIKLCSGDTVSDVVASLGTELCTIMDQLNVTNYDLSCLDITGCAPSDFKGLIELLIKRICELNDIPADIDKSAPGCPDCVVSVAPCFIQDTQTTMQLVDYVQMIANKICTIINQITAINNELVIVNNTLIDLQYQIDNLPVYTLPSIPADCILPAGNYPLDQILNALMNNDTLGYCSLLTTTGTPAQIVSGVLSQCIADGDSSLASLAAGDFPVQSFSTYYAGSWVNDPALTAAPTVSNAIKNIWIAICDMYNFLTTGLPETVVDAGNGIIVTSATVGNTTTYTVSEDPKPVLYASVRPLNLAKTTPSISTGRLCDGQIQIMPVIENDFGAAYNPATGIWTCPATGIYNIGFFISYMKETDDGWYDAVTPGKFIAGITSPAGCNYYCVNNNSSTVIEKHASINGSIVRPITENDQLCLKVINLTNFNYTSTSGDIVTLSIQRVK